MYCFDWISVNSSNGLYRNIFANDEASKKKKKMIIRGRYNFDRNKQSRITPYVFQMEHNFRK